MPKPDGKGKVKITVEEIQSVVVTEADEPDEFHVAANIIVRAPGLNADELRLLIIEKLSRL